MELYILDDNYRKIEVIDRFESLLWTERFQASGDFEMSVYSTRAVRSLFTYGTKVACNKSKRVMIVDELENKSDSEGRQILTIKGNSLERVLADRVVSHSANSTTTNLTSILIGECTTTVASDTFTYANHGLVTGDFIYFKTAGKLAGYIRKSLAASKVKISTAKEFKNCFILKNHGFKTGEEVYVMSSGTIPAPLVAGTIYYVIENNNDTFMLATSLENVDTQTAIDITSAGSGTHTIYSRLKPDSPYSVIRVDENTFKIAWTPEEAELAIPITLDSDPVGVQTLYWYNYGKIRVSGLPMDIVRALVAAYCIDGYLDSTDIIPLLALGDIYPIGTNSEPTNEITVDLNISTMYDLVKQLCEVYGMGFRIVRNNEQGEILFSVYSGDNKTTNQTLQDPVVFDSSLDNLLSDTEYISVKDVKNVAYVYAPNGFAIVYSGLADSTSSGLDKRVLHVDASDITLSPGYALDNQLLLRGQQALAEHRTLLAFDGEIPTFGEYIYDVDYKLGDLVEVRNADGYTDQKRVTEQIFSDDVQGEKSYPTLSSELVITPGSWMAWDTTETWDDLPIDLTWDDPSLI